MALDKTNAQIQILNDLSQKVAAALTAANTAASQAQTDRINVDDTVAQSLQSSINALQAVVPPASA